MYHLKVAKIMQKKSLMQIPNSFLLIFKKQVSRSITKTRSNAHFVPYSTNTVKCRQSLRYNGRISWNSLPDDIKWKNKQVNEVSSNIPEVCPERQEGVILTLILILTIP